MEKSKSSGNDTKKRKKHTNNLPPPPLELKGNDFISNLPPEIIHNILRCLDSPSEAARTSILSKAWNHDFWRSYPVVEYRDSEIHSPSKFRSFVASSSRRLLGDFLHNRTPLSALRISLVEIPAQDQLDELLIGSAASLLAASCGSPREISIEINGSLRGYNLPRAAFRNCSRTTVISLIGFNLAEFGNSFWADHFPNLESLCLQDDFLLYLSVDADPDYIKFLVRSGLGQGPIHLTAVPLMLKNLELRGAIKLKAAAPNLKSVAFHNNGQVTQQDLDEFTSLLPALKSLSFRNLDFESRELRLKISSPRSKLRMFSLTNSRGWKPLQEIVIDAPELATFVYDRGGSFSPPVPNVNVVNVASDFRFIVVADGNDCYECFTYEWHAELRLFLETLRSQFHGSLVLKLQGLEEYLSCRGEIQSKVPWNEITSRDLVDVNHLELDVGSWINFRFSRNSYLLDGCFSMCRPGSMSVFQSGPVKPSRRTHFVEYICRQLMSRKCRKCYHANKCWRHSLKEVQVKSDTGETMPLSNVVVSSLRGGKLFASTFVLTWEL